MSRSFFLAVSVSVYSLTVAPAWAGGLDVLLQEAQARDPQLAIAEAQADASAAQVGQARAGLLPRVSGSAGYTRNQVAAEVSLPGLDTVVITPIDQLEASARLDVPLLDLGAWSSLSASVGCSDATSAQSAATSEAALLAVVQAAWDLKTAEVALAAAAATVDSTQHVLDRATARLEAGAGSTTDVLRARADLAKARGTLAESEADVEAARRALAARTGADTLPDDLQTRPLPQGDLAASASQRPELVAARATFECQSDRLEAQRLGAAPTVGGFFQERVSNATGFAGQAATWSTGVTLSWTPIDGGRRSAQVAEAAANRRVAEATLAQLEQRIADDLADALGRVKAGQASVAAAVEREEASSAAAADAQARFDVGTTSAVEVSLALSDAFDAGVNLARAQARLAVAVETLRLAAGQPLVMTPEAP